MRAVQVGIKYGGKGEVDVTGLEMELREPYKVCMNAEDQMQKGTRCWGLQYVLTVVVITREDIIPSRALSPRHKIGRDAPLSASASKRRTACWICRLLLHVAADTALVLCLSPPAIRWLDFGRARGATDGGPSVPRPRRGERVSIEYPAPYGISMPVTCSCHHENQRYCGPTIQRKGCLDSNFNSPIFFNTIE